MAQKQQFKNDGVFFFFFLSPREWATSLWYLNRRGYSASMCESTPRRVSAEAGHTPPAAPEHLYLRMFFRVPDQSEELIEETAPRQRHGEFFRPAAERLRPGQPPGRQLRLADCDDHPVWSFHPV